MLRIGLDVHRVGSQASLASQRRRVLTDLGVDLVIDGGAGSGEYARGIRALGHRGAILSFEPVPAAFGALSAAARSDPAWHCERVALGERSGRARLHVSANLVSSSLLPIEDVHQVAAPKSRTVDNIEVAVDRIDRLVPRLGYSGATAFVKLDVQGSELAALRGATQLLADVAAIELELSLVPLYRNQPPASEVLAFMESNGFRWGGLEPVFADPEAGFLLQVNGLFYRPATSIGNDRH